VIPVLLVAIGSVGSSLHQDDGPSLLAGLIGGAAAAVVITAWIRPRTSVLANGAVVGAYFALGLGNGPIFLTVPLVVFVASRRTRPRPLLEALIPALALIVAGLVTRVVVHDVSAAVTFWQISGLIALGSGAGVLGWWLTDRGAGRREQAQRTVAEERLRMAQDLHDGVGHGLAVISMHAAVALHVLDKIPPADEDARETDERLRAQLRQSLEVMRDTGRESLDALRAQLAAFSHGPQAPRRPAPGLPELDDLLARVRTGGLSVVRAGEAGEVPEEIGQTVYAVVQESLTNVLRHARARRATVSLTRSGPELLVSISDDGPGPGSPTTTPAEGTGVGMGIPGLRARVERLGGSFESGPEDGGFQVRARLPVPV
jgi:signal transduction histidine kinase